MTEVLHHPELLNQSKLIEPASLVLPQLTGEVYFARKNRPEGQRLIRIIKKNLRRVGPLVPSLPNTFYPNQRYCFQHERLEQELKRLYKPKTPRSLGGLIDVVYPQTGDVFSPICSRNIPTIKKGLLGKKPNCLDTMVFFSLVSRMKYPTTSRFYIVPFVDSLGFPHFGGMLYEKLSTSVEKRVQEITLRSAGIREIRARTLEHVSRFFFDEPFDKSGETNTVYRLAAAFGKIYPSTRSGIQLETGGMPGTIVFDGGTFPADLLLTK